MQKQRTTTADESKPFLVVQEHPANPSGHRSWRCATLEQAKALLEDCRWYRPNRWAVLWGRDDVLRHYVPVQHEVAQ